MNFKSFFARLAAVWSWLSEAGHRRALAVILTFVLTHFAAQRWSGLDIDTVDAGLGFVLSALGAIWTA